MLNITGKVSSQFLFQFQFCSCSCSFLFPFLFLFSIPIPFLFRVAVPVPVLFLFLFLFRVLHRHSCVPLLYSSLCVFWPHSIYPVPNGILLTRIYIDPHLGINLICWNIDIDLFPNCLLDLVILTLIDFHNLIPAYWEYSEFQFSITQKYS